MKRFFLALFLVPVSCTPAYACDTMLGKYAQAKTVDFCLYVTDATVGAVKVESAAHASGDTYLMKDEGNEANTTNGFTDEGSCYSIALTSTEMTAARVTLNIEDQGTKTWADKCIVIETYGHSSAEHAFDLDAPPYDGVTASETSATPSAGNSRYGLATGAVDADDQFNNGYALVVYDSSGQVSARSCIFDSANTGDTVDVREDLTALTAVGDSYIVQPDAGCTAVLASTQTTAITGNITGNLSGSVGSVATGGIAAASFAAGAIDAAAIAADAIGASEIATDAIGAAEIAANAINDAEVNSTLTLDITGSLSGSVGSVTGAVGSVGTGGIAAASFASGAIDASAIAADAIGASELATDSIGAAELAADSIGASEIAANAIGASEVASSALAKGTEITGFNDLSASDVNAEVVDVISTDTQTELTSCPAATASFKDMFRFMYMLARNKFTQTSTTGTLYRDDGSTALCTYTDSDNGTTFTRGEGG